VNVLVDKKTRKILDGIAEQLAELSLRLGKDDTDPTLVRMISDQTLASVRFTLEKIDDNMAREYLAQRAEVRVGSVDILVSDNLAPGTGALIVAKDVFDKQLQFGRALEPFLGKCEER
jgi:hypothetical protein